jgi:hypothetical protein
MPVELAVEEVGRGDHPLDLDWRGQYDALVEVERERSRGHRAGDRPGSRPALDHLAGPDRRSRSARAAAAMLAVEHGQVTGRVRQPRHRPSAPRWCAFCARSTAPGSAARNRAARPMQSAPSSLTCWQLVGVAPAST